MSELDRGTRWRYECIDAAGDVVETCPWRETAAIALADACGRDGWTRAEVETLEVDQARWRAQDRANGL